MLDFFFYLRKQLCIFRNRLLKYSSVNVIWHVHYCNFKITWTVFGRNQEEYLHDVVFSGMIGNKLRKHWYLSNMPI